MRPTSAVGVFGLAVLALVFANLFISPFNTKTAANIVAGDLN